MADRASTVFDLERQVEAQVNRIDFAYNRLDAVAMDVVGWMPDEDNEKHHNAVEMLLRVRQELEHVRAYLTADWRRRWRSLEHAERVEAAARRIRVETYEESGPTVVVVGLDDLAAALADASIEERRDD